MLTKNQRIESDTTFLLTTHPIPSTPPPRYVDQSFLRQWIELFDAEDPRERDYVKTVLHRMYGKFMSHRSFIRKAISQVRTALCFSSVCVLSLHWRV